MKTLPKHRKLMDWRTGGRERVEGSCDIVVEKDVENALRRLKTGKAEVLVG